MSPTSGTIGVRFIVVTGLPASGKTTVGRSLAREFGWPFIDKDDILETLFDTLGAATPDDRHRLSRASDVILRTIAGGMPTAVIASHWQRPELSMESGTPTDWLRDLPQGQVIEVFCDCPPEIAAQRYLARVRHPNHFDRDKTLEGLTARFEVYAAMGAFRLGRTVTVDANQPVDAPSLVRVIAEHPHQTGQEVV